MIESVLKKFGLNDKEITIYLTLLKLGSASVRVIADKANINRTTTHDILTKLIEEGLVSFVDKSKHRYFTAESPQNLLQAIRMREQNLNGLQREVKEVLPELKSLYEKSTSKPKAKYFEGAVGIRSVQEDVLSKMSKHNEFELYYVISSSTIRDTLHKVYPNYDEVRVDNGIYVKTISFGAGGTLHGLDERKWLTLKRGAPTYIILYANKVALISLDENKEPICVVIEDKNTYETQVMLFEALWKTIK